MKYNSGTRGLRKQQQFDILNNNSILNPIKRLLERIELIIFATHTDWILSRLDELMTDR
jgi:hypothetical protein